MDIKTVIVILGISMLGGCSGVSIDLSEDTYSPSLCLVTGCSCSQNISTSLVDVVCSCQEQQVLKIGLLSLVSDSSQPPENTVSLLVENCHHVELYSRVVNHMKNIQNITIRNSHTVVIHPKLYEARGAATGRGLVDNIELTNIHKLIVKRYSFKDLQVKGRFYLGEVSMASVVSMAFEFEYVKEFSVFASKFDRISMHGIKLARCKEFNVLGMTTFGSLAAHAIKVKCDKFSLAYNWFGHLHDSSLSVEYGLCDVQGNTFTSLAGKPFLDMKPSQAAEHLGTNEIAMTGLVFRENKFASEPVLPFASLAMPSYSLLSPSTSYLDIDSNQFPCSCQKLGWLLAFGKFGYNSHSLAEVGNTKGSGTTTFIKQLYNTAGPCIECDHRECVDTDEGLDTYAVTALEYREEEGLTCKRNGLAVRNYDDTSDKQLAIVDTNDLDDSAEGNSHYSNDKHEKDINKISDNKSNQRNKVLIDNLEKTYEADSDDVYNMISQVKEEILTQPQQLKKESSNTASIVRNQNKVDIVSDKNQMKNQNDKPTIRVDEEKERLLAIPGEASEAELSGFMLLVTVIMAMIC